MPQFDISTYYSQIFWLILIFGILYFFISRFIAPTAENILASREKTIRTNLEMAEELDREAKTISEQYDQKIKKTLVDLELLYHKNIDALELGFSEQKQQLAKQYSEQMVRNIEDIDVATKSFWAHESGATIQLATAVIKKITDLDADLNLLKRCYDKIK